MVELLLFRVEQHKIYYTFSSSTFLLFPMAVLLVASALIVRELRNKKIKKSNQRKKVGKGREYVWLMLIKLIKFAGRQHGQ